MKTLTKADYWHSPYQNAPFGGLLRQNSFFDTVRSAETIYLAHVTTNLQTIIQQKTLYASAGCLVGSPYCAPLLPKQNELRAHNLGAYMYTREAHRSLAAKNLAGRSVDALIIEVTLPATTPRKITGVNYLRIGDIHLQIFNETKDFLPKRTRDHIQRNATRQTAYMLPLLKVCRDIASGKTITNELFFDLLTQTVARVPMLGYLYFEALTEYIVLFSQDQKSHRLAEQGELNCWGYKELIFLAQPSLLRSFDLGKFRPSLQRLGSALNQLQQKGVIDISYQKLLSHVKERFSFLVNHCLFVDDFHVLGTHYLPQQFEDLVHTAGPFIGHAIDREIRRRDKYGNFHYYFDSHKARLVQRYWDKEGLIIPFNGLLPKGEVGINPSYPGLQYKIYRADTRHVDDELYMQPAQQLEVQLIPELINPNLTFMGLNTRRSDRE
jgi:hypothetical protein